MERTMAEGQNGYNITPIEYPISDNNRPATYDQFISLRDTLIYSNKYYADSAGRSLIIGTKLDGTATGTIEIWEPNIFHQSFEPGGSSSDADSKGTYVKKKDYHLSCDILKKGRYRLQHKEQFNNIDSSITRIHSYILHHHGNETIPRAVFDWEWNTPGEIKRVTAFGYIECNLDKGDWLELLVEDQNGNSIIPNTANDSNRWMVEYIDLAY